MIPAIGIMVGGYIVVRMLEMLVIHPNTGGAAVRLGRNVRPCRTCVRSNKNGQHECWPCEAGVAKLVTAPSTR